MLVYPNAKLNLGLRVTGRREDGYHTLETIFYPIPLCDILEVEISKDENDHFYLSGNGEVDDPDNLVTRALCLLRKEVDIPPVSIALDKHIPSMAGLGGGSSDAAFMLKLLNERFDLNLPQELLKNVSLKLGADCPFFLSNTASLATGIGEKLQPLPLLDLKGMTLAIVKPPVDISTPSAYKSLGFSIGEKRAGFSDEIKSALVSGDFIKAKDGLSNDFEIPAFEMFPILREIKRLFLLHGALFSLMSGSGSAMYGIFEKESMAEAFFKQSLFDDCFKWSGTL